VCGHEFPLINILPQKKKEQSEEEKFAPSCSTSTDSPGNIKKCTTITSEISSLEKNESESDCADDDFYHRNDDNFNNNESCNKCRGFEQDILIRKLVEKWWAPLLKASELNKEAEQHLERDLLDEALKTCNQSLEVGELLLRLKSLPSLFVKFTLRVQAAHFKRNFTKTHVCLDSQKAGSVDLLSVSLCR
jgi:hypothetical protein